MVITRLFSHVTGVVAAIAITLGLITAPAPAHRPAAEPAAVVVVEQLEVALVGIETVLADVVTGVVNALKTTATIVLLPVLLPLGLMVFGYKMGGAGICVAPCKPEDHPMWKLSQFLEGVWSFLSTTPAVPAAAVTVARAAEAVTNETPSRPTAVALADAPARIAPARETRPVASRETRIDDVKPRRDSSRAAVKVAAPAATADAQDAGAETATEGLSGRSGKAASQRTSRSAR